jgi:hypothetical protein
MGVGIPPDCTSSNNMPSFLTTAFVPGALITLTGVVCARAVSIGYDFTVNGSAANVNGAFITTSAGTSSSGTGTFGGYLTVGGNTDALEGISTDSNSLIMPNVTASQTSALPANLLSAASVTINGVSGNFYSFYLDLNEPNSADRYVSVDTISIYARPGPTTAVDASNITALLANNGTGSNVPRLVWSMDTLAADQRTVVTDRSLLVNELSSGSGTANLLILIPQSYFTAANVVAADFLYIHYGEGFVPIFTVNSGTYNFNNAGGFEEFGIVRNLGTLTANASTITTTTVPEAGVWKGILGVTVLVCGHSVSRLRRTLRVRVPPQGIHR